MPIRPKRGFNSNHIQPVIIQLGRERLILLRHDDYLGIEFSWIGAERAGAAGDDDPHVAFGAVIGTNRGLDGCKQFWL